MIQNTNQTPKMTSHLDSLKFSALSLCLLYYAIIACRDRYIYAFSIVILVFFASIDPWYESWWQVVYVIGLGTVFALLSTVAFDLQRFADRRRQTPSVATPSSSLHVHRFNRNFIFSIELILLSATFLLIDHEIVETDFPIGIVITFIFLCFWFLFILLIEWLSNAMLKTYFFLVISFAALLFAHWKIYASVYVVNSVACAGAFGVWWAVSWSFFK